jgi:hypothetical protein
MLNLNTDDVQPAPKPKSKPKASSTKPVPILAKSEALEALRAATSAAEAEENERYELKDSVDARLTAWKGGKETNIRALIASLDTILWPKLGWQKVGMHELVSNAQVKSRYTRAIARLHPDKVSFCYVRFLSCQIPVYAPFFIHRLPGFGLRELIKFLVAERAKYDR